MMMTTTAQVVRQKGTSTSSSCLLLKNCSSLLFKSNFSGLKFYSTTCREKVAATATVYDLLLHKHHFSPDAASRLASVLPPRLRNPQKSDSVLSFFKHNGFSNTHLEKIVKYRPSLISANLDKFIKPKIKIFQDLGLSAHDIAHIIANDPSILYRSTDNRVIPSLAVLKGLLGSNEEVAKLVRKSGWFLIKDLDKSMVPNIQFLKSCSVSMEQIIRSLYSFPRFLLHKPKIMRKCAEKVEEMGVKRSSKMFIHAVRVVGSMTNETWELKLQAFRDMGFSEDDILKAFRRAPLVFAVSEKKMKNVKEVLVSSGKYDMSCIINHPTSLICSTEKRYNPRLQVLGILESKNLITVWPRFTTFFNISDDKFFQKFVSPYLDEVGDAFLAKREVKLV
ncbi:hypothetical protein BUALT_Bualt08G0027000 [Buddleja alternifolia]|uniref:Uncharacterized protein n=1 Tax=Buddleja alternifolia TaxID=168488 RepID=A0AAV6XDW9_9LAMI|nr:hypothetical protein BUALT_Bualt08G0027000 [Buddleja alternifolia]